MEEERDEGKFRRMELYKLFFSMCFCKNVIHITFYYDFILAWKRQCQFFHYLKFFRGEGKICFSVIFLFNDYFHIQMRLFSDIQIVEIF